MNPLPDHARVVIGLEIHGRLQTRTKLFSAVGADTSAPPNTRVGPVCLGQPGTLPRLQRQAVEQAVRVALALGARVAPVSRFDRKHYAFADLPRGYQITQYHAPLATGGALAADLPDGSVVTCALERLHLEEDTAQSVHDPGSTRLNFNRAGLPLLEVVTAPALHDPDHAMHWARALRAVMQAVGACDGRMEEGAFRMDANVSLVWQGRPGTRVEIKNLNSFRHLRDSLAHEVDRHADLRARGLSVEADTRTWDPAGRRTLRLRAKETTLDYRYLPDPDLPPLVLDEGRIEALRRALPELPAAARVRLEAAGVEAGQARALVDRPGGTAAWGALQGALAADSGAAAARWLLGPVARDAGAGLVVWADDGTLGRCGAGTGSAAALAPLVGALSDGRLTHAHAEILWAAWRDAGGDLTARVEAALAAGGADADAWEAAVREVVESSPAVVARVRAGHLPALNVLVGQALRHLGGQADAAQVRTRLRRALALDPDEDA